MAPSAVEVETTTVPDVATLKLQAGPYKELAATKYDRDAEAGLKGHKAAKVRSSLTSATDSTKLDHPH
jgi:sulfonate dioxygenase